MNVNQLFSEVTYIQQLNVEDALTAASYPASGSFIEVSKFERFAFLIGAGALNSQVVAQVQQAAAANGALKDVADATVTISATDDDKWYLLEVQTDHLDTNHGYRYVTLTLTGPAGGDDYAAIFFLGLNPGYAPVVQGADKGAVVAVVG